MKKERWFAIINPESGNGKTANKWPLYAKEMERAGITVDFQYTKMVGHGTEITRTAIQEGFNRFIAVGGDGTVNEVVNGLLNQDKLASEDLVVAVFASGTGSDFAKLLPNNDNINSFIHSLRHPKYMDIDIGKTIYGDAQGEKERYFINASNIGLGARVIFAIHQQSRRAGQILPYFFGTLQALIKHQPVNLCIRLDNGKVIEGNYHALIICNGQYIGGGMKVAPRALPNDGYFDVILVKDAPKHQILMKLPLIYLGEHVKLREVERYKAKTIQFTKSLEEHLEADGEIIGSSPKYFSILSDKMRVLI